MFIALKDLLEALRESNEGRVGAILKANGLEKYEAFILGGIARKNEIPTNAGFELMFNREGGKVIMDNLVKKELVVKDESTGKWDVTDKGAAILKEINDARDKFREKVCAEFSEEELKDIVADLQKLRASVLKN